MAVIAVLNPNTNANTTAEMVAIVRDTWPAGRVRGITAASGPTMIVTAGDLARAAAAVLDRLGACAGADGVIVAGFGDPGASALAASLDVPVIGIGAAAARAALEAGGAFAVVTTTPGLVGPIDTLMIAEAPGAPYLGTYVTPGDPLPLMDDPDALDAALLAAIGRAADDGARRVIIGGGPLGTAAVRLRDVAAIPLIEPLRAAADTLRRLLGHPP